MSGNLQTIFQQSFRAASEKHQYQESWYEIQKVKKPISSQILSNQNESIFRLSFNVFEKHFSTKPVLRQRYQRAE
jgi:hypothetical protein